MNKFCGLILNGVLQGGARKRKLEDNFNSGRGTRRSDDAEHARC